MEFSMVMIALTPDLQFQSYCTVLTSGRLTKALVCQRIFKVNREIKFLTRKKLSVLTSTILNNIILTVGLAKAPVTRNLRQVPAGIIFCPPLDTFRTDHISGYEVFRLGTHSQDH